MKNDIVKTSPMESCTTVRRQWTQPLVTELPALTALTLQSGGGGPAGDAVGGSGGSGGLVF